MSFYHVLKRFQLLSALEGDELSKWSVLCKDASEDIKRMLKVKESALAESQKLRLDYCAGALAYYRYCLYTSANNPHSFQAGEVKVINGVDVVSAAKRLYEEELKGLSDVVCDNSFCFRRVRS